MTRVQPCISNVEFIDLHSPPERSSPHHRSTPTGLSELQLVHSLAEQNQNLPHHVLLWLGGFQMAVRPSQLLFKASSNELWIERLNMFTFSNWKNQVTANSLPVWHWRPCPRHRARCVPAARRWPRVRRACLLHSCGHGHRHGPPCAALGRESHGSLWRSSLRSVINS